MERSFGVVCKTPIAAILESLQCCYGDDNVEVRRLSPTEYIGHDASIDTDCIRFYLLDCIVDRKLRPPRRKGLSQGLPRNMASETPCKIKCYVESDTDSKQDYKYRSAVAISNEASVFYCHLDKFTHEHQNQQLGHKHCLVPIGISWLRLIAPRHGTTPVDNLFAAGGYVRHLHEGGHPQSQARSQSSAWLFTIFKSSDRLPLTTLRAWQCPDLYGCRWPPDTFTIDSGIPKSYWSESHKLRHNLYLQLLYERSTTQKVGCRWHVPGALYTGLSKNALVISPSIDGAHDIVVRIQESEMETWGAKSTKRRDLSTVCESIVSVRYINPRDDKRIHSALNSLTRNGESLRTGKIHGVRTNGGDNGKMFALGARVDPSRPNCPSEYARNKAAGMNVPDAFEAMAILGMTAFPLFSNVIQILNVQQGVLPLHVCRNRFPVPSTGATYMVAQILLLWKSIPTLQAMT